MVKATVKTGSYNQEAALDLSGVLKSLKFPIVQYNFLFWLPLIPFPQCSEGRCHLHPMLERRSSGQGQSKRGTSGGGEQQGGGQCLHKVKLPIFLQLCV